MMGRAHRELRPETLAVEHQRQLAIVLVGTLGRRPPMEHGDNMGRVDRTLELELDGLSGDHLDGTAQGAIGALGGLVENADDSARGHLHPARSRRSRQAAHDLRPRKRRVQVALTGHQPDDGRLADRRLRVKHHGTCRPHRDQDHQPSTPKLASTVREHLQIRGDLPGAFDPGDVAVNRRHEPGTGGIDQLLVRLLSTGEVCLVAGRIDGPVTLAIEDGRHHGHGDLAIDLAGTGIDQVAVLLGLLSTPGRRRGNDAQCQEQAAVRPLRLQNSRTHRQESQLSEKPQAPGSAQQQERGTSGFEHCQ